VREEEIIDIISILDSNKATGPDKISNKTIISIKNEIAKPLCLLVERPGIKPDWNLYGSLFLCKWLKMFLNTIFSNIFRVEIKNKFFIH
jgi:hypothetical protein